MPRKERSDRTCTDCGTTLMVDHRAQTYGCDTCGKAWSMERLDDFGTDGRMPQENGPYEDWFDDSS